MLAVLANRIRKAHDAVQAVEPAAEFRPDVVVLDIALPKMHVRRSFEAGFDQHMVKPIDLAALEQLLADAKHSSRF